MTSVLPTVTKVKFDADMFTSLKLQEWIPGYNRVGIDQLIIDELCDNTTFLVMFLASCTETAEYNDSDLLSVKASENGILEKVYGPVVLASEDNEGLVLRCGSNKFPIIQKKNEFILGQLVGEIVCSDIKIKDQAGAEKTISIPQIEFAIPSDDSIVYSIRVYTKEGVDGDGLKRTAKSGKSIAPFLNPIKSGSSNIFKLEEFPSGEYSVTTIELNDKKEWNSYTIYLEGGQAVWAGGSVRRTLNSNYKVFKTFLAQGKSLTLKVASKTGKNGERIVDASLFPRAPKAIAPKNLEALKPAEVIETEVSEVKQGEKAIPF